MSTIDLFSKRDQPAIDRPLIAYAFLAQASQTSGDLLTGLAPIFKPLAKGKLGQRFEPREFAKLVGEFYGIEIHPWAVDDLAPRLEKAGLLVECHPTATTREYLYADVQGDFNQVTEADIRLVVKRFVDFARPILERHKLPVEERALEEAFFAQLTAMDFHAILLKPDSTKEDQRGAGTLGLPKKSDRIEWEDNVSAQSKINVLCAAFIVEASQNDEKLYDLLVQIASGALIAEVVLNVQDPGKTVSLDSLRVIVDAPFLMSLLDLSGEDSHAYARRLCEKLREKAATLQVFRHSTDEIRDNLEAVTNRVVNGAGFGATARRLAQNAFRSYATVILHDVASAAAREGIKVIDPLKSAAAYQYCSEADESAFRQALGYFDNAVAQTRDAASIAGVIRLRHGIRAKMSKFHQSQYVFVTENPWIAECAGRFVRSRKMNEANEVPPAVTDRYLAGLLWILFGGKAAELTQYRLLANCSVALEPRGDVISKMHRFLSGLDENKAKHFRALMTVERASQHLMQLTLGDSVLINSANDAEEILNQVEAVLGQRFQIESDRRIADLTIAHETEVERLAEQKKETEEQARNTMAEVLKLKNQATALQETSEKFRGELYAAQHEKAETQRMLLEKSVGFARSAAAKRQRQFAIVAGLLTAAVAFLGTDYATTITPEFGFLASMGAGFLAFVGFWNMPEMLFGNYFARVRANAFQSKVAEYDVSAVVDNFEINWTSGKISLKR